MAHPQKVKGFVPGCWFAPQIDHSFGGPVLISTAWVEILGVTPRQDQRIWTEGLQFVDYQQYIIICDFIVWGRQFGMIGLFVYCKKKKTLLLFLLQTGICIQDTQHISS